MIGIPFFISGVVKDILIMILVGSLGFEVSLFNLPEETRCNLLSRSQRSLVFLLSSKVRCFRVSELLGFHIC